MTIRNKEAYKKSVGTMDEIRKLCNENNIDNDLTALMAYYAYLFIGMDLDTMSPLGGTEVLHVVESIVQA